MHTVLCNTLAAVCSTCGCTNGHLHPRPHARQYCTLQYCMCMCAPCGTLAGMSCTCGLTICRSRQYCTLLYVYACSLWYTCRHELHLWAHHLPKQTVLYFTVCVCVLFVPTRAGMSCTCGHTICRSRQYCTLLYVYVCSLWYTCRHELHLWAHHLPKQNSTVLYCLCMCAPCTTRAGMSCTCGLTICPSRQW